MVNQSSKYNPLGSPPKQPREGNFKPNGEDVEYSDSPEDVSGFNEPLRIMNEDLLEEYNCLTGNGPIKPGDVLIAARPFIFVPGTSIRGTRCEHCFRRFNFSVEKKKFIICRECDYAYYCDESCANRDSENHTDECRLFSTKDRRPSSDCVRFILRFLLKMRKAGAWEADIVPSGDKTTLRRFKDLMDHFDDILASKTRRQLVEYSYKEIKELIGVEDAPSPNYFLECYGRMVINSFYIIDSSTQDSVGSALYLGPSIMNHSCVPNASVSFDGKNIIVRSLVSMPVRDFSNVLITYVDLMDHTSNRRCHLEKNYYFTCMCERCENPKFERSMFAIKCKLCDEENANEKNDDGMVPLGQNPKPEDFRIFTCDHCHRAPLESETIIKDYLEAYGIVKEYLNQNSVQLDVSNFCLKLMKINNFHAFHIYFLKASECALEDWWEKLFENKLKADKIEAANNIVLHGRSLLKGYEKYSNHMWSHKGFVLAKLAKAEKIICQDSEAKEHLQKANAILSTAVGVCTE